MKNLLSALLCFGATLGISVNLMAEPVKDKKERIADEQEYRIDSFHQQIVDTRRTLFLDSLKRIPGTSKKDLLQGEELAEEILDRKVVDPDPSYSTSFQNTIAFLVPDGKDTHFLGSDFNEAKWDYARGSTHIGSGILGMWLSGRRFRQMKNVPGVRKVAGILVYGTVFGLSAWSVGAGGYSLYGTWGRRSRELALLNTLDVKALEQIIEPGEHYDLVRDLERLEVKPSDLNATETDINLLVAAVDRHAEDGLKIFSEQKDNYIANETFRFFAAESYGTLMAFFEVKKQTMKKEDQELYDLILKKFKTRLIEKIVLQIEEFDENEVDIEAAIRRNKERAKTSKKKNRSGSGGIWSPPDIGKTPPF